MKGFAILFTKMYWSNFKKYILFHAIDLVVVIKGQKPSTTPFKGYKNPKNKNYNECTCVHIG